MISILIFRFLIGVRHAFEPDHVAAVVALAARTTSARETVRFGAVWGIDHTITLVAVSSFVLTLN